MKVSDHLEGFLEYYIESAYQQSTIEPIRELIRPNRRLNQLLYDNRFGIRRFHNDLMEIKGFTFESARKFFNVLQDKKKKDEDLVLDLRYHFVYSKMTNLEDLVDTDEYLRLQYVEFMEMIVRVAHSYWAVRKENEEPNEDSSK